MFVESHRILVEVVAGLTAVYISHIGRDYAVENVTIDMESGQVVYKFEGKLMFRCLLAKDDTYTIISDHTLMRLYIGYLYNKH